MTEIFKYFTILMKLPYLIVIIRIIDQQQIVYTIYYNNRRIILSIRLM